MLGIHIEMIFDFFAAFHHPKLLSEDSHHDGM
jgi:hypothetical protein